VNGFRSIIPPLLTLPIFAAAAFAVSDLKTSRSKFQIPRETVLADQVVVEPLQAEIFAVVYPEDYGDALSKTFSRPLFSDTRRPYQVPIAISADPEVVVTPERIVLEEAPQELAPDQPEISLHGVIRDGMGYRALVADNLADTESWLAVGENIQGWTIVKVERTQLLLTNQGAQFVVRLFD